MQRVILSIIILSLVSSSFLVGVAQGKRGMVTLHFYEDLNDDHIYDNNEPSPPRFIVHLRTEHTDLNAVANRLKLIGGSGDAFFRFIPYPAVYNVTAYFQRNLGGMGTEIWYYKGNIDLTGVIIGTRVDLPVKSLFIPT